MKKTKFLFCAFLLAFAMSCNEEDPIDIATEQSNISFGFYSHDISEIEEISTGIYTAFASGNPNTLQSRLRQFTL
ncbi:MAG: hypothetical protein AAF740_04555, partial [Bacteroidota bacterium]